MTDRRIRTHIQKESRISFSRICVTTDMSPTTFDLVSERTCERANKRSGESAFCEVDESPQYTQLNAL